MARDLDTGITTPTPVIVDEQAKAAAARAAAAEAASPATLSALKKSPDELLLDRVNAQISDLQNKVTASNKAQGLNADGSITNARGTVTAQPGTTLFNTIKAANDRVAADAKLEADTKPTEAAPEGYFYQWHPFAGGGGEWRTVKNTFGGSTGGSGNNGNGNSGNGNGGSGNTTTDTSKPVITDATKDAFAMLTDLFTTYGLGSLAGEISGYMTSGLTASEALIKLKTNPSGAYAERFAGNFARQKKGLNVMSESAYIELESSYAETLKAYGLGNMLSTDPKTNWKQFSTYIENDISALEFKDRIKTVEERVVNADASIKATFKQFYPSLTDQDLVAYFLNPTETIDKLKEKVTSAEIGAAFLGQGLAYTQASATELAKYGIDRAGALQGAADIKSVLPTSEKLSSIYGEAGINYNQKSGEAEFLKSNQDAVEQRKRLKSMERASFQGDSGVSQQYGSLNKNIQGAF
jgi:hypothetical protein